MKIVIDGVSFNLDNVSITRTPVLSEAFEIIGYKIAIEGKEYQTSVPDVADTPIVVIHVPD